MSLSDPPTPSPGASDLQTFGERLSAYRHSLFNALGVMMAFAEMAQRDPAKYPRLGEVVLEKSEILRNGMLDLSQAFQQAFPEFKNAAHE